MNAKMYHGNPPQEINEGRTNSGFAPPLNFVNLMMTEIIPHHTKFKGGANSTIRTPLVHSCGGLPWYIFAFITYNCEERRYFRAVQAFAAINGSKAWA